MNIISNTNGVIWVVFVT